VLFSAFVCVDLFIHIKEIHFQKRNEEMLLDDVEIERKWIMNADISMIDMSEAVVVDIEQTYISFSPEIRVRKLNNGQQHMMTIKNNMTSNGMKRDEYEIYISEKQYNNLISKKEGKTIHKTRYEFNHEGYLVSIDIFHGELAGLAYFEVEFINEKEAKKYKAPDWVIKEVTNDLLYKNGCLAQYGIPESYFEYIK
jgi:CYTH domain-containing protein